MPINHVTFDLETTSKTFKGRKGSFLVNKILCTGFKYNLVCKNCDGNADDYYGEGYPCDQCKFGRQEYLRHYAQDYMPKGWLQDVDLIIGFNIKYDMLYIWRDEELQDFFKRGGKIFDCQLAEYMLSGQQHKYPALRDIAVNKYGLPEREKLIEKYKIGKELDTTLVPISELLVDVQNDVLDTEQVYLKQVELAKEMGMYDLIVAHMDGLLATTEMEFNGMYIDQEVFNQNQKILEEKIKVKKAELMTLVEKYWK